MIKIGDVVKLYGPLSYFVRDYMCDGKFNGEEFKIVDIKNWQVFLKTTGTNGLLTIHGIFFVVYNELYDMLKRKENAT